MVTNGKKVCSKCNLKLELKYFSKDRTKASGYYPSCKDCNKEVRRAYWENYYAEKREQARTKKMLLERCPVTHACRKILSKESHRRANRTYREKHRDRLKEQWTKYNRERKPITPEKAREYKRRGYEKLKSDPIKWLNHLLRTRLRDSIKRSVNIRTSDYIDYTADELREHLENQFTDGMSWDNYGRYGWHIDHIRPIASFDMTDSDQIKECWALSNLRPLWAKDNLRKGASWDGSG